MAVLVITRRQITATLSLVPPRRLIPLGWTSHPPGRVRGSPAALPSVTQLQLARVSFLPLLTAAVQYAACHCEMRSTSAKTWVPFPGWEPNSLFKCYFYESFLADLQPILILWGNQEKLSCSLSPYIRSFRNRYPCSFNLPFVCCWFFCGFWVFGFF